MNQVESKKTIPLLKVEFSYDKEEIKQKILKLLQIEIHRDDIEWVEDYINIFETESDFECYINELENKTIYSIRFTKQWVEKLNKIRKFIVLISAIKKRIDEKFEYRKTQKALYRYNDNQEKEELKLPNDISWLDWKIFKIKNLVFWEDKIKLNDLEKNYSFEKKKEEKQKNKKVELEIILKELNIDIDVAATVSKYNLLDLYEEEIYLYKKNNFEHNIEIQKQEFKNKTNKKDITIKDKWVFENLYKYRNKIIIVIWSVVLLSFLKQEPNTKYSEQTYAETRAKDIDFLSRQIIYKWINSEEILKNHWKIFLDSTILHYLQLLEKRKIQEDKKESYFMSFYENFFLLHFRNISNLKIIDANVTIDYIKEKSSIKLKWFFQLLDWTKYFIDTGFLILSNLKYSDKLKTNEYKEFNILHNELDKHLWKILSEVISSTKNKGSLSYKDMLIKNIQQKLNTANFEELYEKWFIKSNWTDFIQMVNKMEIDQDNMLVTNFIIYVNDRAYVLTYKL